MPLFRRWFSILLFVPLIASCSKEKEEPKRVEPAIVKKDSIKVQKNAARKILTGNGLYSFDTLSGAQSLADLSAELGAKKMFILFKINRRDLKHLKEKDVLALPNSDDSEMTYSPFPLQMQGLDSVRKIIIVSRKVQAFGAYENGKLVKWGPTSTGKKSTPTPEGLFHTNWKSKETHSTVDEAWVLKWYFNLDNLEGVSLHEYDLPGYPVSHSCVRLLAEDAEWIYNWAEQWKLSPDRKIVAENGTPVIVFGDYAYGKTPPWKKLITDEHASDVSEETLKEILGKYLPEKKVQLSSH